MQRRITRFASVPAFAIDVATLDLIAHELLRLFASDKTRLSITLQVSPTEELKFGSVAELRENAIELPSVVTRGSVEAFEWIDGGSRTVAIRAVWGPPYLLADSPNLAWAAGALEVCRKRLFGSRVWYWFLRPWHVWLLASLSGFLPTLSRYVIGKPLTLGTVGLVAWLLFSILLWAIVFRFDRLFPGFALVIRPQENWFRRNATELTLGLTVLSLIVSVVALFR